ncbi:Ryanodine receptor 2 [Collichthys lucidus]|uniref:Ryanodine receptor 2 n=1 Tax=Collichthys lucidus TaxID=240159 RepID=A0A4U5VCC7_COLLU|nr:Ryanodine receptor 2 [Collichthys lucidus]
MTESGEGDDEYQFLRTGDDVVLQSTFTSQEEHVKLYLAAEGFGSRLCRLEPTSNCKNVPPDLSVCGFVLAQCLSVRALQEMLAHSQRSAAEYLSCLSSSQSSTDKLAFDVGLQEDKAGEACWWTVHPASRQRSEGEKVRVGDDLILVNVSSERYLHLSSGTVFDNKSLSDSLIVNAAFQQTLWSVAPICSGEQGDELQSWSNRHTCWGQPFRLCHLTTGRYLGVTEEKGLHLVDRDKADINTSSFCFRSSKEKLDSGTKTNVDGMGIPEIKYGDSICYVQHVDSGLWLTYQAIDAKSMRMGVAQRKAILHSEGHMDDGLTLSRSQREESHTARLIRSATLLFTRFIRKFDSFSQQGNFTSVSLPMEMVTRSLQDLINYFQHSTGGARPGIQTEQHDGVKESAEHVSRRDCIDRLHQCSASHFAEAAQSDTGEEWEIILNCFYELLGVLEVLQCVLVESPEALNAIKEGHIHSIISFLDKHGCNQKLLFDEAPTEVVFQVLEVLCSLCVCHGVAVRSNQNLICDNLLPDRDLLLQTRLTNRVTRWYFELVVDHVDSFLTSEPTHLRVGWACTEGYQPRPTGGDGWGSNGVGDDLCSYGFDGLHLWSGCVGRRVSSPFPHLLKDDDVVSCCLDLSAPCISFRVNGLPVQGMLENFSADGLLYPVVSFSAGVRTRMRPVNTFFVPFLEIRVRFLFGGRHGEFRFLPPPGFAPCSDALLPRVKLKVEPCHKYILDRGEGKQELIGPLIPASPVTFTPAPVDISKVVLPPQLEDIREKMADNIHELWAVDKIDLGWTYGPAYYQIHVPFSAEKCRVFRPDKSYAVTRGKWYFEFEVVTAGNMRVGWARPGCTSDKELGSDDQAYVFDGSEAQWYHEGIEPLGRPWQRGDVVGCLVDMAECTMIVTLNGEVLFNDRGSELAAKDFDIGEGRKEQEEVDSDFEVLRKSAHGFAGSRDELNHKDHSQDKASRLKHRFMLKKTKPGLVSRDSSARLLEDVVIDKDNYDRLVQSSRNAMPLSAGLLRRERRNATPQCPPRFQVQQLRAVSWTRVPDRALNVTVDRPNECHGWRVQCSEPLQVMTLHVPDENRFISAVHSTACLMTSHEYIVPMTDETRAITLYPSHANGVNGGCGISTTSLGTSLKPRMHFSSPCFVRSDGIEGEVETACTDSPEIPLEILKNLTVEMLTAGDLWKVLRLIEPGVFSIDTENPAEEDEEEASDDEDKKEDDTPKHGLLQMKLPEAVKLELCHLLSHLCDCQLRHRVEAVVAFSDSFVGQLQENQRFRYNQVMQALNMSAALTARKTKEFRSPPQEQINMLLSFKEDELNSPCPVEIQQLLQDFHHLLNTHCGIELDSDTEDEMDAEMSVKDRLLSLVVRVIGLKKKRMEVEESRPQSAKSLKKLISETMVHWAQETEMEDPELVRAVFALLHRQYQGLGGQMAGPLCRAYTISQASVEDTRILLSSLIQIRSLLSVRMGKEEERLMIRKLGRLPFPRWWQAAVDSCVIFAALVVTIREPFSTISATCWKTGSVGLASPSMRGATPLDVAAASVMDNNELALALREPDLEKVVQYLAGCGLQSCPMLVAKGYPEIGWNPVEGERYLDFLRFAVFCNGESVEENAYVVLRLLIRRPECFGPALRGDGGNGLLAAMEEAIRISDDPSMDGPCTTYQSNRALDVVQDNDDDLIHMGHAIMTFYSALIDLLGRCAPEMHLIQGGKGEAIRIRAILRSLIPIQDLEGVISISFQIPSVSKEGVVVEPDLSTVFCPDHKAAMVLFLDRVYGIESQSFLLHLLEVGFLPDLQAAVSLDTLLTSHYEERWKYYSLTGGQSDQGLASEEELHLSRKLFWGVFKALAKKPYEPQLSKLCVQCLAAVAKALPPDHMDSSGVSHTDRKTSMDTEGHFDPQPVDIANVLVPERLEFVVNKYAEHTHEKWSLDKFANGWVHGEQLCENTKVHPLLKPYRALAEKVVKEVSFMVAWLNSWLKTTTMPGLRGRNPELESKEIGKQWRRTFQPVVNCFGYTLLQQLLSHTEDAQEHMLELGNDASSVASCLHVLAQALDARTLMKSAPESIQASLHSFFEAAAADLEITVENLSVTLVCLPQSRSQQARGVAKVLSYTTSILLPTLTSLFQHLGIQNCGCDLLVGSIQVSCYRILNSLYSLGTSSSIYMEGRGAARSGREHVSPPAFSGTGSGGSRGVRQVLVLELTKPTTSMSRRSPCPCCAATYPFGGTGALRATRTAQTALLSSPSMPVTFLATSSVSSTTMWVLARSHFLPVMEKLRKRAECLLLEDEQMKAEACDTSEAELQIQEKFTVLVRDLYAFYPLLIPFVDSNRAIWLMEPNPDAEHLFSMVAEVFIFWAKSHNFKWEEQNYVVQNEINNLAFLVNNDKMFKFDREKRRMKRKGDRYSTHTSLIVASMKKLLPVGLRVCFPVDQSLITLAKNGFTQKNAEDEIREHVFNSLLHLQSPASNCLRQENLYVEQQSQLGTIVDAQRTADRILEIARVLYYLDQVEHPQRSKKPVWHKVLSKQRKRAVVACLRMAPLYNLPRHRAVNLFLQGYNKSWISAEDHNFEEKLVEDLALSGKAMRTLTPKLELVHTEVQGLEKTGRMMELLPHGRGGVMELSGGDRGEEKDEQDNGKPIDPLLQLITLFSRSALTERSKLGNDRLYQTYAAIMAKSCHRADGGDDDGVEQEVENFEEKEMEKQKLLYQQARLHRRGASEMVLQTISASKGAMGSMIAPTLKLGIAVLSGGNATVQQKMLDYLRKKRDVGFFQSIAGLMLSCSVLDLNAFERKNKAEGLGMAMDESSGEKVMPDKDITCDLFRFLQLLCEGHNSGYFPSDTDTDHLDFQNYLRTQTGNNTTVNIIISTVDYLLRVQESISDFYWYYSGKDVIDVHGQHNFSKAIKVAKQVFNTLTEYIQLTCLSEKRDVCFNDAAHIVGPVHREPTKSGSQSSVGCCCGIPSCLCAYADEALSGNVVNGTIGKQMVDMLVESSGNVEMILKFFNMFLKLKDLTSSDSFREYDPDRKGCISRKDFQKAMENCRRFTQAETHFLLSCTESDESEILDYEAFVDRFHEPAKDISFSIAVLLTNLSEHMPSDSRLRTFLELAECVLTYFQPYLGRIEILGSGKRIERVYFEISESSRTQWEKPQVKESKRQFIFDVVNEGGEKEKMEMFVNFCEDTIFEMQLAAKISGSDSGERCAEKGGEEKSKEEELENKGMFFMYHWLLLLISVLSVKNLKTLMKMTLKDFIMSAVFLLKLIFMAQPLKAHAATEEKTENEKSSDAKGKESEKKSGKERMETRARRCSNKSEEPETQQSALWEMISTHNKSLLNCFARNFYNMRLLALFVAFSINFILLFYKVASSPASQEEEGVIPSVYSAKQDSAAEADNKGTVFFVLEESSGYMEPSLHFLAVAHTIISFCCIIGYYCLKVPLVIFKREKEVARRLEFDGLYVTEQPPEEDIKGQWDRLVINTPSFPSNYWDKFVKRKVMDKYGDVYGCEKISELLGLDQAALDFSSERKERTKLKRETAWSALFHSIDMKYQVWKVGVVFTDNSFLYLAWYMAMSVLGHYNDFFFAVHLLDIAMGFKTLRTILSSVTHNGKQLVLTVGLLAVVVYLYTVVAFNFFRKFYNKSDDKDTQDMKCNDMLTCYMFHMNVGVRAGGGIGDEIVDPAGDEFEVERVVFDITFFFFVVVILLAIIQGLIIDAFGELRDQQEQVKEDMESRSTGITLVSSGACGVALPTRWPEMNASLGGMPLQQVRTRTGSAGRTRRDNQQRVFNQNGQTSPKTKCFICGIGSEYFDKVPHGFETHTLQEHNLANYLFFLMYLINKDETEHTGQESFVWKMYQERSWEFFPVGDCFHRQQVSSALRSEYCHGSRSPSLTRLTTVTDGKESLWGILRVGRHQRSKDVTMSMDFSS